MSVPTTDEERTLSAECILGQRPGLEDLHRQCRQIADVPLPHSNGLLLIKRCGCGCHRPGGAA
ncbi:hypothetical protein ACIHIX_46910 [Streptomyces sp. NPDC051913]|uniref:hypothetical protein n=1 Tax=Streptomyces sp. NPDC051913 TaxID=3365676 RepID=UPI0037CD8F75